MNCIQIFHYNEKMGFVIGLHISSLFFTLAFFAVVYLWKLVLAEA